MNGLKNSADDWTGLGKFQVNVTNLLSETPMSGARVRILNYEDNSILEELETDSSGQTQTIELPAPPLDFSLEPTGNKPYSEYNVLVFAQDYEPKMIEGVQIFSDSMALQNTGLNRTVGAVESVQTLALPQHTLWGIFPPKIPEAEVKPLPPSGGLVVLPGPVIPEFIVVHLGDPADAQAENAWVPFKDYIKSVASSEIYSTWPNSSLEANILAIISFTLNRVYTEWYRGQGYEFTITNSTAYDQSFQKGRTIYTSISQVVDQIFTTYVTRPEIRQPLLTQYCDGKRTRCSGLEQWGSKSLGDDGLDSLSILRHYYGSTVFLKQAESVAGVPISFPGVVLQNGSSGPAVRTIQQQINAIAGSYPALPKVRVDGVYGPQTQESVRQFQKIFDLPQTGSVDYATWYEISRIYVIVSKLAEL